MKVIKVAIKEISGTSETTPNLNEENKSAPKLGLEPLIKKELKGKKKKKSENTVMTGNFTQFSIDLFNLMDYYFKGKENDGPESIALTWNSFKKVIVVH